jgi:hypothetical protein
MLAARVPSLYCCGTRAVQAVKSAAATTSIARELNILLLVRFMIFMLNIRCLRWVD